MKRYILFPLCFCVLFAAPAQRVMTLEQCLDSAMRYNRSLQNAALSVQSAQEQQKEAYTNYFPKVQANALAFQAFDKIVRGDGTIPAQIAAVIPALASYAGQKYSIREFSRAYNLTLAAMEPVYAGGRIHTANSLAAVQREVSLLQYRLKEKDIRQKITNNYWKIASLKYDLNTVAAAEKQVDEMYRQVELFVSTGVTTRNDLLRVSLRRHELQSSRLQLENGRKVLLLLLAQQIGLAGQDIDIVADTTAGDVLKNNLTNGMVAATVSVPISDWWGGTHAVRRKKIALRQAKNDLMDAREQLQVDISSAYSDLEVAYKQIDIARASVEQSEENLRITTLQYKAGIENLTNLLDAETLNRQAHNSLSTALATYHSAFSTYMLKTR